MTRLIDPGVGEITDRLTILSLKILFATEQGKDVSHFRSEWVTLLAKIRSKTLNAVWFEGVLNLAAVNASLWHGEDELRRLRQVFDRESPRDNYTAAVLGFRLQALNDRRAELIAAINKDAGEPDKPEKL